MSWPRLAARWAHRASTSWAALPGLTEAMLAEAGFALVHVPGFAVNRARQGTRGGENKSDPRDARVIADQVRMRRDLRVIEAERELDLDMRLLVGRRRDLVDEQTQRIGRLHDLLVSIFPSLERAFDYTTKGPLWLVSKYVTPAELRASRPGADHPPSAARWQPAQHRSPGRSCARRRRSGRPSASPENA